MQGRVTAPTLELGDAGRCLEELCMPATPSCCRSSVPSAESVSLCKKHLGICLAKERKQDQAWISILLVRAVTWKGGDLGSSLLFQWVFVWFILNSHWIKYFNSHRSRDSSLSLSPPLPGEGPKPPESHAPSCYLPISLSLSNESAIIWWKRWNSFHSKDGESTFPLFLERWVQRLSGRAGNSAKVSLSWAVGSQQEQWSCSCSGCACSEITHQTETLRGTTHTE